MASMSIIDKMNFHQKSHLKHYVVQTRSFQIEKYRNVDMYPRLRIYIKRQNEKRKQEMEMSEELKRAKREKELKHNQDKLTLGEIKDEIARKEQQLIQLENDKHRLFAEFKKVLNEDDSRKNLQRQKEANAITNLTFGPTPLQSSLQPVISSSAAAAAAAASSAMTLSQSQLSQNVASLKFPPPPPPSLQAPQPLTNPPAVIPNSAMLSLQHSYFAAAHQAPPPPLSSPVAALASITSSSGSSSLSYAQQTHRSLNNPVPASNSYSHKPPPPSMYSKTTTIHPSSIASSILSSMNAQQSTNPIIASSMPFQTIPNDRQQRSLSSSAASYKRTHEQANAAVPLVSAAGATLPPPLNLAAASGGHPQAPPGAHVPAFIPGYPPPPPGKQPPTLSGLHPGAGPPPPPFAGISLEHIQNMQNSIPFFHQSLIMSNNPFMNPNNK